MQDSYCIPSMQPEPYGDMGTWPMEVEGYSEGGTVFPEIYYRIQPFVMSTCDAMGCGGRMPNHEMMERMSEDIYNDVAAMSPDLMEYFNSNVTSSHVEAFQFGRGPRGGGRFRRRGAFRDVIDILLLNELFRRGIFFY